ncbi:MAG TPA: hypothetical protein VLM11_14550 [Streptosporangiaceae bacterium]|nr:hypothetical protein [Streptosporangiaceae bacterium]
MAAERVPLIGGGPGAAVPFGARAWIAATVGLSVSAIVGAVVLAPPASARPPEGLAFLLFVGSSVHVASTGWFYTVPEVRAHMRQHPARYVWWPVALIAGAVAVAVLLPRSVLDWLLLPYFGWQFFHYQKQNLGIAALAAASRRIKPLRRTDRWALTGAGLAGIAGLLARPGLLQVPVRPILAPVFPVAATAFAAFVALGAGCLAARRPGQRPPGFCACYAVALIFSLPVFVFSSPYAAVAGLTIAHGLQYLLLMTLLAGGQRDRRPLRRAAGLAALCNIALLGGAALSMASDQASGGPAVRALFGVFLGAVMAHFVVDAGLWRMRSDFQRSFLGSRLPYLVPTGGPVTPVRPPMDRLPI